MLQRKLSGNILYIGNMPQTHLKPIINYTVGRGYLLLQIVKHTRTNGTGL